MSGVLEQDKSTRVWFLRVNNMYIEFPYPLWLVRSSKGGTVGGPQRYGAYLPAPMGSHLIVTVGLMQYVKAEERGLRRVF
jgi:hypothetical protein